MKKHGILYLLLFTYLLSGAQQPRYNEVFQAATHNSYFIKRAIGPDPFAGGVQERILDQLLFEHTRTLEIDIHKNPHAKGQWQVYHTSQRRNSFCADLPAFLKQLLQFHYAIPRHEVVTVILELKEILGPNFDENHTPAELDKILTDYLGPLLYRPSDLLKRCPGDTTLCNCAASSSNIWPTIDELRGKFIFVVLGNWHWRIIGHGGLGWATYACSPNPAAFPMSSSFCVFNDKRHKTEIIPPAMLAKAYSASVFKQAEEFNDTSVVQFISNGGIVRGGSAQTSDQQALFIKSGFQMFLTDYPGLQYNDKGFAQPFRPLNAEQFADTSVFIEPGQRIFVSGSSYQFLSLKATQGAADWETLPSSTRVSTNAQYPNAYHAYGKGCLCAQSADGKNAVLICRQVDASQNAIITVEVEHDGTKSIKKYPANGSTVGDMIRVLIVSDGATGVQVQAYSSAGAEQGKAGAVEPVWHQIFTTQFHQPLPVQGLAAGDGDVLFVGTKLNGVNVAADQLSK